MLPDRLAVPRGGRRAAARPRDRRPGQSARRRRRALRASRGAAPPRRPPDPLTRPRIADRVSLGVRALDTLVPCGRGQRLGIFAGSGVGKSSLLGMIARSTTADVNVIALVGERGREVREFIERDLGDALAHSVVVVATSDQPALVRIRAAFTATAIAEYFRDQGKDVMLMMDSVTRFAMAQREVGLAIGEPPATRGYTPSVFALLPRLLERAGTSAARLDHRPLHGAGRRRRHERADRRRGALDPGRAHRAVARAGARRPLPGDRRAAERLAPDRRDRHARGPGGRHAAAQRARRLPREGGPDLDRRLPARAPTRCSTPRSRCARGSTASCASGSTSRARSTTADAAADRAGRRPLPPAQRGRRGARRPARGAGGVPGRQPQLAAPADAGLAIPGLELRLA